MSHALSPFQRVRMERFWLWILTTPAAAALGTTVVSVNAVCQCVCVCVFRVTRSEQHLACLVVCDATLCPESSVSCAPGLTLVQTTLPGSCCPQHHCGTCLHTFIAHAHNMQMFIFFRFCFFETQGQTVQFTSRPSVMSCLFHTNSQYHQHPPKTHPLLFGASSTFGTLNL